MEVSASVYDGILKQRFPRQEGETDEEWRQRMYLWAEQDRVLPDAPGKLIRSAGAVPAREE